MVDTIKFSQMTPGGDIAPNNKTPGLLNGNNVLFNNAFPNLAPGSTADRPPIDPSMYYRLRFNTTLESWEYYSPVEGDWAQLEDSLDNYIGPFVTFTSAPDISGNFDLGTLTSGILKQSVAAGVATPEIAINGTDYYGPGYTGWINAPLGFDDINNAHVFGLVSVGASAVNYLSVTNSITGNPVSLQSEGTDTNIGININSKGNGNINLVPNGTGFVGIRNNNPQADLDVIALDPIVGNNRTNATNKAYRLRLPNYNNADGYWVIFNTASLSSINRVSIGGGSTLANAATNIEFRVAANTITPQGSQVADFDINGLRLGAANARVTTILNDNTMSAAAATNLYTGIAIKEYVDNQIGTTVLSVTGTTNQINVNNSDPQNPVVSLSSTLNAPGTFTIQSSTAVDEIINDDTMATATVTNLATSLSIKNYVDGLVAADVQSVTGTANEIDVNNTDPQNPILSISSTLDLPGTFNIQASTAVDEIINDNTLSTATATNLATALSIKNYVDGVAAGYVQSVTGTTNQITVNNTDPQNPILSLPSILVAPGTIQVGNLFLSGNTLSSISTNGNINLVPNGTGFVGIRNNNPQADLDVIALEPIVGNNRTDATNKAYRLRLPNYNNADGFWALFNASSLSTNNRITIGGGSTLANAATTIEFNTAANTITPTGTQVGDFTINGFRLGGSQARVTTILDDNTMAAASATNLYTGGAVKGYVDSKFTSGTWTPEFTFVTPGDLTVTYNSQVGFWQRNGNVVFIECSIQFTPVFTTSSGNAHIAGLPFVSSASIPQNLGAASSGLQTIFPAGATALNSYVIGNVSHLLLQAYGSGITPSFLITTNIVSGVQHTIFLTITYTV